MKIAFICKFSDPQLVDLLPYYQEMGIDEIDLFADEITEDVKAFVSRARQQGIPVSSLSPRWGWIQRALKDAGEIEQLRLFIEAGAELGVERVMLSCTFDKPATAGEKKAYLDRVVGIYKTVARSAEAAGIDLCTHTTTRPGIMFGTIEGIDAFLAGVDSPRNKLLFCCGCIAVPGWDVPQMIRRWHENIGAVHLFNPRGNWEQYDEIRFDVVGQLDMSEVIATLKEVGYNGVLIPHEYPAFSGPCGKEVSHGWVIGYLKAMLQVLDRQKARA